MVSGVTTRRDCFQADQNLRASNQNNLSRGLSLGLGCLRFKTVICCRSAKFSSKRFWRERKKRVTAATANQSHKKPNMDESYSRGPVEEDMQAIDSTTGQSFGEAQEVWRGTPSEAAARFV